jgi:hypothetical protein
MRHLKSYNESSNIDFIDLTNLFAEMIDEYRDIAIQTGQYFKSKVFLLKDLISKPDDLESKQIVNSLEKQKPFFISIQLKPNEKRLEDSIHLLQWLKDNETQINYFGYKMKNFYIQKEDLLQIEYISIENN